MESLRPFFASHCHLLQSPPGALFFPQVALPKHDILLMQKPIGSMYTTVIMDTQAEKLVSTGCINADTGVEKSRR